MACLVVGHAATLGSTSVASPLNEWVRDMLDNDWDLFRNVSKIDPIVRLPLTIGMGAAFARVAAWAAVARARTPRRAAGRRVTGRVGVLGLTFLVLLMAQPAIAFNLRTPGWDEVPDYWHQTADYLHEQGPDTRAWVIPGASFGVQTWGWTMDEPMSAVSDTPWVTRSQVPLVPPETIRVLSRLEEFLASGAGSPNLGAMLARLGITDVVVRHDLHPSLSEATSINLVSIAMSRSDGVSREVTYGETDFGPAIEVYSVDDETAAPISVVAESAAVTVAGASADVVDAVGRGLVAPDQAAIVQGDDGWDAPADVVGDAYRLRERSFGRVHDAEGAVLAPGEPRHSTRNVGNYPGNPGSKPVVARYDRVKYVDASSSMAYTDGFGEVRPENAPFSAVDDDRSTAWRTGFLQDPVGQWLDIRLTGPQDIGTLRVLSTVANPIVGEITKWKVEAGGETRTAEVDPFTGKAVFDLTGVTSDRILLTVLAVNKDRGDAPVSVQDVDFAGPAPERTLVVPPAETVPDPAYVFTAQPEVRACITTLLAPDCSFGRGRLSDESSGIDRTFEVPDDDTVRLTGTVIARARQATASAPRADRWRGDHQVIVDPRGGPDRLRADGLRRQRLHQLDRGPVRPAADAHRRLREAADHLAHRGRPARPAGDHPDPGDPDQREGRDPARRPRRLRRLRAADGQAADHRLLEPDARAVADRDRASSSSGPAASTSPSTVRPRQASSVASARSSSWTARSTTRRSTASSGTSSPQARSTSPSATRTARVAGSSSSRRAPISCASCRPTSSSRSSWPCSRRNRRRSPRCPAR